MSYNRPDYLKKTLLSLVGQQGSSIDGPIYLFQDNCYNNYSKKYHCEEILIKECVSVFEAIFPNGQVLLSDYNIGVCENFLRAEQFLFGNLNAPVAYFFEDDLILSPNYITELEKIRAFADSSATVGYFACYGHLGATLEQQRKNKSVIRNLAHHWAFGLLKKHWISMQPVMQFYYDMVVGRDYRERPSAAIKDHMTKIGAIYGVSSQDDVKKAITYLLDRNSINTYPALGKYIGESGLHMTPENYAKQGFAATEWLDSIDYEYKFPDAARLKVLRDIERSNRAKNFEKASTAVQAASVPFGQ
jgi:hypothetical protein